jgi:ABC-2 type transport system permease protein
LSVSLVFLGKELRDARRNKYLFPVYLLLPLLAFGLPVALVLAGPHLVGAGMEQKDPALLAISRLVQTVPEYAGMPPGEAVIRYMLRGALAFYFLMPVALSSISAAFSIVSEKQQRTLEPILAAPITERELLFGKLLASLLPSVLLTWASALAAAILVDAISWRTYGALFLPDRFWSVGVFVLAPLLGAASVLATMRLSAKMTDPQAANQFAGLVIVPIFLAGIGLFGKILTVSFTALLIACLAVLLLALALFRVNVVKFQREEILTRWKS